MKTKLIIIIAVMWVGTLGPWLWARTLDITAPVVDDTTTCTIYIFGSDTIYVHHVQTILTTVRDTVVIHDTLTVPVWADIRKLDWWYMTTEQIIHDSTAVVSTFNLYDDSTGTYSAWTFRSPTMVLRDQTGYPLAVSCRSSRLMTNWQKRNDHSGSSTFEGIDSLIRARQVP